MRARGDTEPGPVPAPGRTNLIALPPPRETPLCNLVWFGEHYRITRLLGSGGMGKVYECEDVKLRRRVAVKCLHEWVASAPGMRESVLREARALAAVRHECILPIYHYGVQAGMPYFVTELVEGGSLEVKLAAAGRIPLEMLDRTIDDAARGLEALHLSGIVHRDVKPANLLFRASDGRTLLADAGLAWHIGVKNGIEEVRGGTVSFSPPEQILGEDTPSTDSDVYALAATAFLALTGSRPFPVSSIPDCIKAQHRPPPSVKGLRPEAEPFDALFREALAPDRRARLETVQEFRQGFARAMKETRRRLAGPDARARPVPYVLVADDDLDIRNLVHACLRAIEPDLEARFASDGELAFKLAQERPPALVVLDLDMPAMNGIEVLAALRGHPATRDVPVIVVSGGAASAEEKLLRRLSVRDVIIKPLDPQALARTIEVALARPRGLAEVRP